MIYYYCFYEKDALLFRYSIVLWKGKTFVAVESFDKQPQLCRVLPKYLLAMLAFPFCFSGTHAGPQVYTM